MSDQIRVLHLTTHDEDCGIAKYQEQFIDGMKSGKVENIIFPYSPNKTKRMSSSDQQKVIKELANMVNDFDILHIQHEFSFYEKNELLEIVKKVKSLNKKVIITVHTAPSAGYKKPVRGGLGPHSLLHYARQKRAEREFIDRHVLPMRLADMVVVHNYITRQDLINHGVSQESIKVIRHPVRSVDENTAKSTEITNNLHRQDNDVIFCTVGFPSPTKGILDAVKSLELLPANYKLAIIGGVHPSGENEPFINKLTDYIVNNNLLNRVYMTGYVEDDDYLNSLIRECDICVYPYDKKYYAHVSSGSLNHAIGNLKPVIAYPTASFQEMNAEIPVIQFTKSFNYYELARSIQNIDIKQATEYSKEYAKMFNWPKEALAFIDIYQELLAK